jgi:Arc/MetJ-type ribon-helix-helix transcriptional regulator
LRAKDPHQEGDAMKNVSISLTDRHAAEIDMEIAAGGYASVSEVVRAALRDFLTPAIEPDMEQIARDITAYREARSAGVPLVDADAAEARIAAQIPE